VSIKNKYTRKPAEAPKRKGNADVLSQMINTEIQDTGNTVLQEEKKLKKATFQLDADLHKRLRTFAAMNDTTMVEIVQNALNEYMDKNQ
jgi:hypothetical protein